MVLCIYLFSQKQINLSFLQNKVGIVVNRVQQSDLGFGLLQTRALGQRATSLPLGLLHRITVFSRNLAYNVGHYIIWKQKKMMLLQGRGHSKIVCPVSSLR